MKKILFIEDDLSTQTVYKEKFSKDYDVVMASTGPEGVELAAKDKPDLIVLDILLGMDMSGFEVLKKIRANVESKNIPVIVLTNLENQEAMARESGAVECLIKANTSIKKVEETIQKYIG